MRSSYEVEHGHDLRGLMCQRDGCGKTMQFVYTLADVGAFCSEACRNYASVHGVAATFARGDQKVERTR